MGNITYFILSITILSIAHFIKIIRQSQFIEIYEEAHKGELCKALSITFLLNLIIPFKLGNIFRILYPAKNMKNGKAFSAATVIIDILMDLFTIMFLYIIFSLMGKNVGENSIFYVRVCLVLVLLFLLVMIFKKSVKKAILHIAGIFNDNIELKVLKTTWYTITSFKNMIKNINKIKLVLYTLVSALSYMVSFFCLAKFLNIQGIKLGFMGIFNTLYGNSALAIPTLLSFYNNTGINGTIYLSMYIISAIMIIYILSFIVVKFNTTKSKKEYIELFPHIHAQDRLLFLKEYFGAEKSEYIKKYLDLNRNVAIIEDYSAGSNATTMLCSKDGETFYRKYSIGTDAKKLYDQIEWLKKHKDRLKLTEVNNVYYKNEVCSYDMPYIPGAVTCFNYIHTMPFNLAWKNVKNALNDIDANLHTINKRKASKKKIEEYIDKKVIDNIKKIEEGKYIKPLLKYDYIHINGIKYHNLNYFKKYLNKEYLMEVFKNDNYSDIHGDFTIENIICLKGKNGGYYIIDPNTGNIHDSPYLDYSKLLQSVHGGYEFLMKTKDVSFCDNEIEFLYTKSSAYEHLYENLVDYLNKRFGEEGLKSIFYHEIIHWLRLMPYKIKKNEEKSLIFYAGLIMVASDVEKRFEKNESSNI